MLAHFNPDLLLLISSYMPLVPQEYLKNYYHCFDALFIGRPTMNFVPLPS
jgi:hypothetical protein